MSVGRAPEIAQEIVRRQYAAEKAKQVAAGGEKEEVPSVSSPAPPAPPMPPEPVVDPPVVETKDSTAVILLKTLPDEDVSKLCEIAEQKGVMKNDRRWGRLRQIRELAAVGISPKDLAWEPVSPPIPPEPPSLPTVEK